MKVVVTGASGFLGRVMSRESSLRGHHVMVISRKGEDIEQTSTAVRSVSWRQPPQVLAKLLSEFSPDCIIHCAGSASVAASLISPYDDHQASVGTWLHLLEAVRLSKTKPLVVLPSSAAVYGNPAELPVSEGSPLYPISPYGLHKKIAEDIAAEYREHFGLNVLIVRLFSVFGPTQKRLLVWELYNKFCGTQEIAEIAGTGHETRDFLSEWCVADAILQLATKSAEIPSVINLASGTERSVIQVANILRLLTNSDKSVICLNQPRPGDPTQWQADTSRLSSLLPEWKPMAFDEALGRTIAAWQS